MSKRTQGASHSVTRASGERLRTGPAGLKSRRARVESDPGRRLGQFRRAAGVILCQCLGPHADFAKAPGPYQEPENGSTRFRQGSRSSSSPISSRHCRLRADPGQRSYDSCADFFLEPWRTPIPSSLCVGDRARSPLPLGSDRVIGSVVLDGLGGTPCDSAAVRAVSSPIARHVSPALAGAVIAWMARRRGRVAPLLGVMDARQVVDRQRDLVVVQNRRADRLARALFAR